MRFTFNPTSQSGIYGENANFTTARNLATGTDWRGDVGYGGYLGVYLTGGVYHIERNFFVFDTSSLPDDAVILNATLSLEGYNSMGYVTERHYAIYDTTCGSPLNGTADFDLVGTTIQSDQIAASGQTATGLSAWKLNATGISNISKTGVTKFCIREVDKDVNNVAPADLTYWGWQNPVLTIEVAQTLGEYRPNSNTKLLLSLNGNSFDNSGSLATLLTDTFTGTPDNWTNFNTATHSFASNEMTIIDNSASSEGVALTNALNVGGSILKTTFSVKISAISGSGTLAIHQYINDTTNFNQWYYLGYNTATGKFTTNIGDLATTCTVGTYYDIEIRAYKNTGKFDVFINGKLDKGGVAAVSGYADSRLARCVFGGGSSALTWTMLVKNLSITTSNFDGTDTAITYNQSNGKFNKGAGFNGSSSYIKIIDSPNIQLRNNFTYVIAFKTTTDFTAGQKGLIGKDTQTGTRNFARIMIGNSPGAVRAHLYNGTTYVEIAGTVNYNDGKWHRAVFTVSSSYVMNLAVDGNYVASPASGPTLTTYPTGEMAIGALPPYVGAAPVADFFTGSLIEPIVESGEWTAAQIRKDYTNFKGRFGIV